MHVTIDLNPAEAAALVATAERNGIAPAELAKTWVKERIQNGSSASHEESLDEKLRRWQAADGTKLMPDVPAHVLFAQWAEEDAQMTDEEKEEEEQLWAEIEQAILSRENRVQFGRAV